MVYSHSVRIKQNQNHLLSLSRLRIFKNYRSCEDKSQYSKLNQYPTINTSQDLYSDANYTQLSSSLPQQQMPPLPTQISSSYTGYYNGHTNNFNYTQPIEQWIPTNQMNTTVQSSYVKSEPMGNNKTDLSSNSIISSDCILLNSSSSSSSTCSPNSGKCSLTCRNPLQKTDLFISIVLYF